MVNREKENLRKRGNLKKKFTSGLGKSEFPKQFLKYFII
jgi:hypothetical protein